MGRKHGKEAEEWGGQARSYLYLKESQVRQRSTTGSQSLTQGGGNQSCKLHSSRQGVQR